MLNKFSNEDYNYISKLRVSGDNLEDVMNDLNSALSDYLGITGDDSS